MVSPPLHVPLFIVVGGGTTITGGTSTGAKVVVVVVVSSISGTHSPLSFSPTHLQNILESPFLIYLPLSGSPVLSPRVASHFFQPFDPEVPIS